MACVIKKYLYICRNKNKQNEKFKHSKKVE